MTISSNVQNLDLKIYFTENLFGKLQFIITNQ